MKKRDGWRRADIIRILPEDVKQRTAKMYLRLRRVIYSLTLGFGPVHIQIVSRNHAYASQNSKTVKLHPTKIPGDWSHRFTRGFLRFCLQ